VRNCSASGGGSERAWATKTGEELRWGEPSTYGSHSLRRAGVTAARQNGVSMLDIQRHGRWKSLVVFAYVRQSAEERLVVTQHFLATNVSCNRELQCMLIH
jgi:hypothetical protein